jgi:hypothetical protein
MSQGVEHELALLMQAQLPHDALPMSANSLSRHAEPGARLLIIRTVANHGQNHVLFRGKRIKRDILRGLQVRDQRRAHIEPVMDHLPQRRGEVLQSFRHAIVEPIKAHLPQHVEGALIRARSDYEDRQRGIDERLEVFEPVHVVDLHPGDEQIGLVLLDRCKRVETALKHADNGIGPHVPNLPADQIPIQSVPFQDHDAKLGVLGLLFHGHVMFPMPSRLAAVQVWFRRDASAAVRHRDHH